ncbi:hypothetical protein Fmac_026812 [Flemingia macrophylla]|uniref:Uncharacterized protein n=1 Tax=Flemingia macrophylla TaxID=520843 RepID=A0ABD1LG75_9FABA
MQGWLRYTEVVKSRRNIRPSFSNRERTSHTERKSAVLSFILIKDFYQPFKEDEMEQSTEVPIIYPADPKSVFCEFDWELDELEVDLLEPISYFLKTAQETLGSGCQTNSYMHKAINFYCVPLQKRSTGSLSSTPRFSNSHSPSSSSSVFASSTSSFSRSTSVFHRAYSPTCVNLSAPSFRFSLDRSVSPKPSIAVSLQWRPDRPTHTTTSAPPSNRTLRTIQADQRANPFPAGVRNIGHVEFAFFEIKGESLRLKHHSSDGFLMNKGEALSNLPKRSTILEAFLGLVVSTRDERYFLASLLRLIFTREDGVLF